MTAKSDPAEGESSSRRRTKRRAGRDGSLTISLHRIAERFRRAREEAGLSLREVAERADLASSTVQKIENCKIIPSIAVAVRLAHALNQRASYFIEDDQEAPPDVRLIRKGRGRRLGESDQPVTFQRIAEPLINPRMEAYVITVQPGGQSDASGQITYRGEEIFICTGGQMRIELREQDYVLRPGDTLHLKGDIPHCWSNPGSDVATMIMIGAFSS